MHAPSNLRGQGPRKLSRGFALGELLFVLCAATALALVDDKIPVRPASEARDHIDQKGTYEFVVRTTKNADKRKVYYLDSEEDFRDEKNLALVIAYEDAEKFKKAGVDDPSVYYKGKTIRVTGNVIHESDQVRIHVTEPSQIELVAMPKDSAGAKP
jgi:hypothetical protein